MSERIKNRMGSTAGLTWVVTGASQGFGRAIVDEVLARGDSVVASVREESSISDLREQYSERLTVVSADLREPGAVDRIAEVAAEHFGAPDVLVNNAGRATVGAAEEVSLTELRALMEVNFFTAAALTRAVLPGMRRRGGGTIIQMSSQGGRLSYPGVGAYSATKFALEGWSEVWPEFVFVTAPHGTGWVPSRHIDINGSVGTVRVGYDTTELPASRGERVEVLRDDPQSGWSWCRDSGGREGWMPHRVLAAE